MAKTPSTTDAQKVPRKPGRPRKAERYLLPHEELLILHFLAAHKERAENGLNTMAAGLELSPTSQGIQGMAERYAKLIGLIEDMAAGLSQKQPWVVAYRRMIAEAEAEPCQPTN